MFIQKLSKDVVLTEKELLIVLEKPWSKPFAYLTPSHVSYSLTGAAACHPGGEGGIWGVKA